MAATAEKSLLKQQLADSGSRAAQLQADAEAIEAELNASQYRHLYLRSRSQVEDSSCR